MWNVPALLVGNVFYFSQCIQEHTTHTHSFRVQTPLDNVFDISDSSSRSQTQCLWHILALLYPHPLRRASKWDTSTESKNHRPSPQTGALCLWRRNRKTDRGGKYQKYCLHLASFQNVDSCKTDVVNLILFFSFTVCKRKALGFSLFKAKYNHSFNGKHWFWASIRKRSLSQMRIYGNERCISHPILHLYSRNEKGRGETSPRITAVIICHSCCMTTHVNSEFSLSFPWRHNGWKKQITWKCVSKRCWNCNLWLFFIISLFYPSRAWTAQVPSRPFHCATARHHRRAAASPRASGFSCGSCPAILLLLLDKR